MTAQIIKRDGRTQDWNKQKIIEAIKKALVAVDGTLTKAGVNMARRIAKNIEKEIVDYIENNREKVVNEFSKEYIKEKEFAIWKSYTIT